MSNEIVIKLPKSFDRMLTAFAEGELIEGLGETVDYAIDDSTIQRIVTKKRLKEATDELAERLRPSAIRVVKEFFLSSFDDTYELEEVIGEELNVVSASNQITKLARDSDLVAKAQGRMERKVLDELKEKAARFGYKLVEDE